MISRILSIVETVAFGTRRRYNVDVISLSTQVFGAIIMLN